MEIVSGERFATAGNANLLQFMRVNALRMTLTCAIRPGSRRTRVLRIRVRSSVIADNSTSLILYPR